MIKKVKIFFQSLVLLIIIKLKFKGKFVLRNAYTTIDELPILNWDKICSGESLAFLYRSKSVYISRKKVGFVKFYFLNKLWRELQEEQIQKFGFSDDFLAICRKKKELIMLRQQKIVNDDKSVNTFIKIAEDELKEMQKDSGGGNFWQLKGALDRARFNITPSETSVTEFYTHVQTLVKQAKAQQSSVNG